MYETIKYKNYDIEIEQDSIPMNPREEFDNLGIMTCFHKLSREKILKEYSHKIVSKKLKERIISYLEAEVKTYDDFLTGNIYGYSIEKDEIDIDSCSGFYGYDFEENGLLECAKNSIDCEIDSIRKNHFNQLKAWIKNKVNFQLRTACPV